MTGGLFEAIENFITVHTTFAPLLLLLVEEAGIPIIIPGDGIIAYTGYSISHSAHPTPLWAAFVVSLFAVLCGASILFYFAKRWGQWIIQKLGRFMFIRASHVIRAEQIFKRYGIWAIILGRHIPGMRIPITIFAATSGISYRLFLFGTFISTSLWILFYLYIGEQAGPAIGNLLHKSFWLTLSVLIGIVVIIVGLHFYGSKRHRNL